MGRGNWFPGSRTEDCEVAYVEVRSLDDEDDDDLSQFDYQDFKAYLKECLGKSFDCDVSSREASDRFRYVGRDDFCFGYNGLFGVFLDAEGDMHHMGIGVMTREDAPAFARSRMSEFATRLFDKLQERYGMSVRTSAWTSAPRVPSGGLCNAR